RSGHYTRINWSGGKDMARIARVVVPGLPHHIISLSPHRPADDASDRASAYHRASAWGAGMDRGARAPARPPLCTRQTRPKAANGPGNQAGAGGVKRTGIAA